MATQVIPITSQLDTIVARTIARTFALTRGFSTSAAAEIAIVVSELGDNLWQHAQLGVIRLSEVCEGERRGLLIEAEDNGPGLPEDAWRDGFSTTGGLGGGLGAVQRLTDKIRITSAPGRTIISAWKWTSST